MQKLLLELERSIPYYPQLAKALGGVEEAVYFQQLYYWSDKGSRKDGFHYKTKEEIQSETCLSIGRQDRVRKHLVHLGALETKLLKANGSPILHYKLNVELVQKLVDQTSKNNIIQPENGICQNGRMESGESADSITNYSYQLVQPNTTPETSINHETSISKQPLKFSPMKNQQRLLDTTNKILGRQFRVLPRISKSLLELFTFDEIEKALQAMKADTWLQDHPQGIDYYLRPTVIDKHKPKTLPESEKLPPGRQPWETDEWLESERRNAKFREEAKILKKELGLL